MIVNRFNDSSATNPALRTGFSYDGANRVASIDHKKVSSTGTATTLHRYDFDYDYASRLIENDSTIDGVSSFTFDELNQLVEADHAGSRDDEAYTLDATGNRDDSNYDVEACNLTSTDGPTITSTTGKATGPNAPRSAAATTRNTNGIIAIGWSASNRMIRAAAARRRQLRTATTRLID